MTKTPSNQQHVLLVEFRIRPAFINEFESAILHNAAMSLTEAGCRRFDVCRDPQDSALFFLYEIYDDQAAIDAHMQSPHYLRSEEHTSELQSLMRISYAVFCLKTKQIFSFTIHYHEYIT